MMIVFRNVSSVVSSSRGCFEKTEKKTPPLSGGALIRAEGESFSADFSVFFSFFFRQNATLFLLGKNKSHQRSEKEEEEEEVFVVVFCGEKRKVSKCLERGRERRKDGLVREILCGI